MRRKVKYQINERHIMKKRDILLQNQIERYIHFKELLRNYVELKNRLETLKEKIDNK